MNLRYPWNEESLDHRNALLYAMGISEEDAKRPVIGLINTWNEMNPGHFPFDKDLIRHLRRHLQQHPRRPLHPSRPGPGQQRGGNRGGAQLPGGHDYHGHL